MGRAQQFLGIGAGRVAEAGVEAVRLFLSAPLCVEIVPLPVFRSPDQAAVAVFFMGRLLHQGKGEASATPVRRCGEAWQSCYGDRTRARASRCNRKPAPLHRHRVRARRCACQQARAPSHWPSNNYIQVRNQDAGDRHGTNPRRAVLRTGHPRLARGLRARRSRAGPPCARDRFRRRAWHLAHHAGLERTRLFRREGDQYLPENTRQSLPGLHATYNLYSARSGVPLAQVDGDIVTVFRTAGAAALGASYLARPDAAVLLIVGSGRIAGLLAQAMRAVRPIRKVLVWNLRAAGAQALAESCARRGTTRPRPRIWKRRCGRRTLSAAPPCPPCRWCMAPGCNPART